MEFTMEMELLKWIGEIATPITKPCRWRKKSWPRLINTAISKIPYQLGTLASCRKYGKNSGMPMGAPEDALTKEARISSTSSVKIEAEYETIWYYKCMHSTKGIRIYKDCRTVNEFDLP